jgi:SAM-dependent methyltransferase
MGWAPSTDTVREKIEKYGLRLDIGPGAHPRDTERFVSVDKYEDGGLSVGMPPDVIADMGDLPFDDGSVKEIWCSHTLEHVPGGRVAGVLAEWQRVLEPGARVIIQVPNFDYVARYWLTGPDRNWAEMMVFGEQRYGEGDFHRSAFTPSTLRADCEAAGFKVLRVELRWTHSQETVQAVCQKPSE